MQFSILLIVIFSVTSAKVQHAVYECPEHQTITPKFPINTDAIYTFPSKAFTQFPVNSACTWLVNIPCNYTATVHLKATISDGGHVTMTQTPKMNKTEKFVNNMEVTRLFYPPSFDIFWYPGASDVGNLKFSLQFQTIDLEEGGEEMEEEDE